MKLNTMALANAMGVAAGVVYAACALVVAVTPGGARWIFDSWFHGIDVSSLPVRGVAVVPTVIGLITFAAAGWLFGYVVAYFYNMYAKK